MAELDDLVTMLLPECSLPCFNKKQIRQRILDTLTERRRNVKTGHDYEKVERVHVNKVLMLLYKSLTIWLDYTELICFI